MVKKQNNNAWIVYVIALIAIVALILAIVAMNKASVTGNAFWNNWFDFQERGEVTPDATGLCAPENGFCGSVPCCSGLTCTDDNKCVKSNMNPDGAAGGYYGLFGNNYFKNGGSLEDLKGLTYSIEYDSEGDVISEIVNGAVQEPGGTDLIVGGDKCKGVYCKSNSDCSTYGEKCSCSKRDGCPLDQKYCNCPASIA